MGFPNEKELEKVRKKLANVEPTRLLPENASKTEMLKFELCREFVKYLQVHKITQKDLSQQLKIDPARINEIVKYKIELFTIDRLLDYAEQLNPNLSVTVA